MIQVMKRFMLFSGDNYYPGGGMTDFQGDFDTEQEAKEHLWTMDQRLHQDWAQIYDIEERKLIDVR